MYVMQTLWHNISMMFPTIPTTLFTPSHSYHVKEGARDVQLARLMYVLILQFQSYINAHVSIACV